MNPEHYTYRVFWSPEDGEYVGACLEFPSLSWLEENPDDAFQGIRELVQSIVVDMEANGETPPQPLAERRYSGRFQVRLTPELHRRLAMEAAEADVSLNRLIVHKLESAD